MNSTSISVSSLRLSRQALILFAKDIVFSPFPQKLVVLFVFLSWLHWPELLNTWNSSGDIKRLSESSEDVPGLGPRADPIPALALSLVTPFIHLLICEIFFWCLLWARPCAGYSGSAMTYTGTSSPEFPSSLWFVSPLSQLLSGLYLPRAPYSLHCSMLPLTIRTIVNYRYYKKGSYSSCSHYICSIYLKYTLPCVF